MIVQMAMDFGLDTFRGAGVLWGGMEIRRLSYGKR